VSSHNVPHMPTGGHTDRQMQTDFIICPMLYAIVVGQIMRCSVLQLLMSCS